MPTDANKKAYDDFVMARLHGDSIDLGVVASEHYETIISALTPVPLKKTPSVLEMADIILDKAIEQNRPCLRDCLTDFISDLQKTPTEKKP